jgi:hypothetical protein
MFTSSAEYLRSAAVPPEPWSDVTVHEQTILAQLNRDVFLRFSVGVRPALRQSVLMMFAAGHGG